MNCAIHMIRLLTAETPSETFPQPPAAIVVYRGKSLCRQCLIEELRTELESK